MLLAVECEGHIRAGRESEVVGARVIHRVKWTIGTRPEFPGALGKVGHCTTLSTSGCPERQSCEGTHRTRRRRPLRLLRPCRRAGSVFNCRRQGMSGSSDVESRVSDDRGCEFVLHDGCRLRRELRS